MLNLKKISVFLVFFLLFIIGIIFADVTVYDSFATDGPIYSVTRLANVAFIGGSFTKIGKRVGYFYFCDINGNEITSPKMPQVEGTVYAITPDGSGGFYIGGAFSYVGGQPRTRLAHILSNGVVDSNWKPSANGIVRVITVGGDGKIYVGGGFTSVTDSNGTNYTRNRLAAFDANGNVLGLNVNFNDTVYDVNYYSSIRLLVGGNFTTVNGENRKYFVVIDQSSDPGSLLSVDHKVDGTVYTIARPSGSPQTFIGGAFTNVSGTTKNRIAMFDTFMNGYPMAQDFNVNGTVNSLYFDNSYKTLYATGYFTSTNGGAFARNYAAAFNTSNAQATAFNPSLNNIGFKITSNSTYIYIGGSFDKVNISTSPVDRLNAAAFNMTTGAVITNWVPDLNNIVYALAPVSSGSTNIAVGGAFRAAKTLKRNNLASINILNGSTIYAWDPNVNGTVYALAVTNNAVYAGGSFTTANGGTYTRNYLAAFNTSNGSVTSWAPSTNGTVFALLPYGDTMYIGGDFSNVNGNTRNFAAAVKVTDGSILSWNPNTNGTVKTLTEYGGIIYAGGYFTTTGGGSYTRNYAAAFSLVSGVTQPWNPNCNNVVHSMVSSAGYIGLGGSFTWVGGFARNRIACVDTAGNVMSVDPNADSTVYDLKLDGNLLLISGAFTKIGGLSRPYFAAYDLTTMSVSNWTPMPNSTGFCSTRYEGIVLLGGAFTLLSSLPHGYGALVECPPQLFTPTVTATITKTLTFTTTPTRTITPTVTRTITNTITPSRTFTRTITNTITATVTRTITPTITKTSTPVSIYNYPFFDNFATDLGWTYETEWERGPATASSGHSAGYPDPDTDVSITTDNYVAGTVIGGNMSVSSTHPYYYLTSPFIDTADAPQLQLRFYRHLNCDYPNWMSATVEVFNGSSWIPIFINSTTIQDSAWKEFVYDVTAYKSSSFRVRFGHAINNTSNIWIMSGWNIDDVYIGLPYTPTSTITPTITPTITQTLTLTYTTTNTITSTVTQTITITTTPTITQTITFTSTRTITETITPTSTISPTSTDIIFSATITPTFSNSPTSTITLTITPTNTITQTITQTLTISNTITQTITQTVTNTITDSITSTNTQTVTQTITVTSSYTNTPRPTLTITKTLTITETNTATITFTITETATITNTMSYTESATITVTYTMTETFTYTQSITETFTITSTMTETFTQTPTQTECVAGIMGNNSFNSFQISGGSSLYASKFELLQDAVIRKIYIYIASGIGKIMVAIYADYNNSPDTLVYPSAPKDCITGWNEFEIPFINLNRGYYWLALQAEAGVQIGYVAGMPSGSGVSRTNIFGTFPDPFGDCSLLTRLWSIYAEFCPDVGYLVTATVTPSITQTSTVTLTSTNTSIISPTPSVTPTLEGPEAPKEGQSYVYPLPAKDKITFVYSLKEEAKVTINIFDFAGNKVKQIDCEGVVDDLNKCTADVLKLTPGVYYYIIKAKTKSGGEIQYKLNKFIIKR